jgi:hypothetical protein
MQNAHFDTPFAQRLAKIDLSHVMARLQMETGFDDATVERAEDLYRKFLTLAATYPGRSFVPPRIVDEVWHNHILFTRHYVADCDLLFGHYLHHNPHLDADVTEAYNNTIDAYQQVFNVHPANYGLAPDLIAAGVSGL